MKITLTSLQFCAILPPDAGQAIFFRFPIGYNVVRLRSPDHDLPTLNV